MAVPLRILFTCIFAALPAFCGIPSGGFYARRDAAPIRCNATEDGQEALHRRNFFYAGGQYVFDGTKNGSLWVNKQYVEELTPACGVKQPYPLVFLHGGADSGVQWLNRPGGGKGWASYFLDQGYKVFIIDIWTVGRSSDSALPYLVDSATAEFASQAFSAPEHYKSYYQATLHTQWPSALKEGAGLKGDPIFDEFYQTLLPLNYQPPQQNISSEATCAALERIGPSILVTHSAAGATGWVTTDKCPGKVKGHVAVEADQGPFRNYDGGTLGALAAIPRRLYGIADVPITYDPPVTDVLEFNASSVTTGVLERRLLDGTISLNDEGLISKYPCQLQPEPARKLPNIAQAPVLFLTGEASVHALYDQCLVQFLNQAGVSVKWTQLQDVNLKGNGHFLMLEKNALDIAKYVENWLEGAGLAVRPLSFVYGHDT